MNLNVCGDEKLTATCQLFSGVGSFADYHLFQPGLK
jgi:hypothetical protein